MNIKEQRMNKKSFNTNHGQQVSHVTLGGIGKLTWSALGLSALLALSACSGGDDTAADDTAPVSETDTTVIEVEEPADTETATSETVEPVDETIEVVEPVDETIEVVEPVDETVEVVEPVEETAAPAEADAAAEPEVLAADAGAQLYETQCHVCHEKGLLGAPKFGNAEDWAPHLAKDIETLHMHSAKGFNKMPAQANADVSEAQVHAAVDYMVEAAS